MRFLEREINSDSRLALLNVTQGNEVCAGASHLNASLHSRAYTFLKMC